MTQDRGQLIENISDTARWVAIYRAMESERRDGLFNDPYARRLGGRRGEEIAAKMPGSKTAASSFIVRTQLLDELITNVVAEDGVDTVINLAAGLDARPYRMALPSSLRWFEVDLPEMISYKSEQLADAKPKCQLERIAADLSNAEVRRQTLARLAGETKRALILTEGLLLYLQPRDVEALATDLASHPGFVLWAIDLVSPWLLQQLQRQWDSVLSAGNAPMHFGPAERGGFFAPFGWAVRKELGVQKEARRLGREMSMASLRRWLLKLARVDFDRLSMVSLLERSPAAPRPS
jgi:methyltransferase (TIGR00027 family)